METQVYDLIVIGSGQGGGPIATTFGKAGHKTALIEREHVGGTCVNEGCTPTKTMIASARTAYVARRAADYGVSTGDIQIDMTKVRQRKRAIVDSFRGGSERSVEQTPNLDFFAGEARFVGPKEIEVKLNEGGTQRLKAERVVINAGERPSLPDIPGLEDVPVLNSTTIMELDEVPAHLLIVGGGYIGLEFGQMFRRFGSHVTIIQRGKQLLPREDADIVEALTGVLREDGIEVLLNTQPVQASGENGSIQLTVRSSQGQRTINGSHLLMAVGRSPNSNLLNLAAAGIETDDKGYIRVNERLETNVPGVFAIGDIKGGPAFTHISYDDFRILRTNLLENGQASTRDRMVPYTVFTDPQFGRVGMSEGEARAAGRKIKVASMPMSSVARALEVDETRGLMKAIVDADDGQILGCAILGIDGGEIMSMIQIAMMGKLHYEALRDATFAHPTLAESLNNLFTTIQDA